MHEIVLALSCQIQNFIVWCVTAAFVLRATILLCQLLTILCMILVQTRFIIVRIYLCVCVCVYIYIFFFFPPLLFQIIRGSEILEVLHTNQDVKNYLFSLYNCQYADFFKNLGMHINFE